jgi:hypothetical protein
VFAAIPQMIFADGRIYVPRTELKHEASARVSPGAGMAEAKELLD